MCVFWLIFLPLLSLEVLSFYIVALSPTVHGRTNFGFFTFVHTCERVFLYAFVFPYNTLYTAIYIYMVLRSKKSNNSSFSSYRTK